MPHDANSSPSGENDGSYYRRKIESGVGQFLDLWQKSDIFSADQMHATMPHILVDFMAHTRGSRAALAASLAVGTADSSRPRPILVNYLGYPGTMGSNYMDYAMVDPIGETHPPTHPSTHPPTLPSHPPTHPRTHAPTHLRTHTPPRFL